MISKCQCQSCGEKIEFEASEFEWNSETSHRKLGQTIDCPHCGKPTQIYVNKAEFIAPKKQNKQTRWLFAVIEFSIVGLIIFLDGCFRQATWQDGFLGPELKLCLAVSPLCLVSS